MPDRSKVRVVIDADQQPTVYVDDVRVPGKPEVEITARPELPMFSYHHPTEIAPRRRPAPVVTLTYRNVDIEVEYTNPAPTNPWAGARAAVMRFTDGMSELINAPGPTTEEVAKLRAEIEALGGSIVPHATADDRPDAAVYNTALDQIRAERATEDT